MALQWREPQNTIKPAKTLGEILIQLTLNYASPNNLAINLAASNLPIPIERCHRIFHRLRVAISLCINCLKIFVFMQQKPFLKRTQ